MRAFTRRIATGAFGLLLLPIISVNVENWAVEKGIDRLYQVEAVGFLRGVAEAAWFYPALCFSFGVFLTAWCFKLIPEKRTGRKKGIFEVVSSYHPARNENLLAATKIRFIQRINNGEILIIVTNSVTKREWCRVVIERNLSATTGEDVELILATFPREASHHPWWGSPDIPDSERKSVLGASKNMITLSVSDGQLQQKEEFYLEMLSPDSGSMGKFVFLGSKDLPFGSAV